MAPTRKNFTTLPRARLGQARDRDSEILEAALAPNEIVSETEDLHAELNYVRFETTVRAAARVVSKRLSNKSRIWRRT